MNPTVALKFGLGVFCILGGIGWIADAMHDQMSSQRWSDVTTPDKDDTKATPVVASEDSPSREN